MRFVGPDPCGPDVTAYREEWSEAQGFGPTELFHAVDEDIDRARIFQ